MRLDPLDLFNLNHSIDRLFNVLVFWFLLKAFESCIANDCHSYNTTYNDGCDNFVAKDSVGLLSTQRELLACEVRPGVGLTALSSALGSAMQVVPKLYKQLPVEQTLPEQEIPAHRSL